MKCEICGFDRYVEKAHIIPRCLGGGRSKSNTVILCPNHHRLLDLGRLTSDEIIFIEDKLIKLTTQRKIKENLNQLEYLYWQLKLREFPPEEYLAKHIPGRMLSEEFFQPSYF